MTEETGFILTSHSRDVRGRCEFRYYGTGTAGPFLLTVRPGEPLFFVRRDCPAGVTRDGRRRPLDLASFDGTPVDGLYFSTLDQYYRARRELREGGAVLFESDVRPEERYLMERHVKGAVTIQGAGNRRRGLREYRNPKLSGGDYRPVFRILSLDIETGRDGLLRRLPCDRPGRGGEAGAHERGGWFGRPGGADLCSR